MIFCHSVRARLGSLNAQATNEAVSCAPRLETGSSPVVSLIYSAAEVFSFNEFTLLLTEAPILDYIVARAAREKLRLHRERFHPRRIRA